MNILGRFLLTLIFTVPVKAVAASFTVCSSGCDGTNIQSVYSSASCGDIIEVLSNDSYDELLVLDKVCSVGTTITLKAGAGFNPRIDSTTDYLVSSITISGGYNIVDNIDVYDQYSGNGILITGNYNTVKNSNIDQISTREFPTGVGYESVRVLGDYNTVENNYVGPGDHGALWVGNLDTSHATHNKILSNTVYSPYGHCISVGWADYTLVEGNIMSECGVSCSGGPSCGAKNAVQMWDAANNTFRYNIFHDFRSRGFEVNEYHGDSVIEDNWFYNNTIYNGTYWMQVGISAGLTGNFNRDNKFFNNIVDPVSQSPNDNINDWYVGVLFWYLGGSDNCGDTVEELITSDFCGNTLKNNIIRPYNGDAYQPDEPSAITYVGGSCGINLCARWTVSGINTMGASHSGNVTDDPLLLSTDTGTTNWWYLGTGSPAIDAGVVIVDPNAAVGGWAQPTYSGSLPDIGAYESDAGLGAPSNLSIFTQRRRAG